VDTVSDTQLLQTRAAALGATFAAIELTVHLSTYGAESVLPALSPLQALAQFAAMVGICYGAYRGGWGWSGLIALKAILAAVTAAGLVAVFSVGEIPIAHVLPWAGYGAAGLVLAPGLVAATWRMYRLSNGSKS